MLVLTRLVGERIIIGEGADKIVVQLLATKRDRGGHKRAIVGVETRRDMMILRSELVDKPKGVE